MPFPDRLVKFGADFKDSAEKLTQNAVSSSKKVARKLQVQNTIRQAEAKLNETYAALGKKYEELYGNRSDPDFAQYMADIADARAQIAAARAELNAIGSASVCPNCGKYMTESQNFCPYCGSKRPEESEAVVIDAEAEVIPPENDEN